jgi:hypothetical protein
MAVSSTNQPVRGTQLLVEHMGSVFHRPPLVAIEIAWRWLFGIPFLLICAQQARAILAAFPLESSGFNAIDSQNPWIATTQLAGVFSYYEPHVAVVARWLLPAAAIAWIVISGLGRAILLAQLLPTTPTHRPFRPFTVMFFRAVWLGLFAVTIWGWLRTMHWVATAHITIAGGPDLVGFAIWAIFLSLGFFSAWALVSWTASVAPILALLENRSAFSALAASLSLGKPFTGKLAEINFVLGIVKLALLVVAMVFSAAPLPFSDELGSGAMHFVYFASAVFFFVSNDYFQVVRLEAFREFWKVFRGAETATGRPRSD